jgi:hypothetical protein
MPGPSQDNWSGQSYGWRYLAQRIDGTGTPGPFLDNELPLTGVTISDVLSGPPQIKANINPVYRQLLAPDGHLLLGEWGTVIYAEADGVIRGGCILVDSGFDGPAWSLDCSGFSGYAKGMAYPGNDSYVQADACDLARHIWATIQADNGSNLNLQVDPYTTSGVLLGTPAAPAGSTNSSGGPYTLNWWTNFDLGSDLDKLATGTPFDYHERHVWSADRSTVDHFLDFGYPSLGRRRDDLRFVYGENIQTIPKPNNDGTNFSNHVMMLGAGQGSAMIRREARVADGRLRRMVTISDTTITNPNEAALAARLEMARRQQMQLLSQVAIRNTEMAPLGALSVGDEIRVQAETDWAEVDMWARVIQLDITPETPDLMVAHLIRSDWVL